MTWVLILQGCDQPDASIIRFGLTSAPIQLDPRFATDASSERLNRLIYQSLVDFDEQGKAIPSLASWQVLSDKHFRFTLKPTLFHSGQKLTSKDVLATYRSILDKTKASPHRDRFKLINRIDIISDSQIDFILSQSDSLFPSSLTRGILPAHLLHSGHAFNQHPMGSGDFKFVKGTEQHLQLERITDGTLFEFITVKDPNVRVLKIIRGELDLLQNDLPAELLTYLTQQKNMQLTRLNGRNFSCLGFNLDDPITGNATIRQAIVYAIDRQAIVHYLFNNGASLAKGLFPKEHWLGYKGFMDIKFNPVKAKQLLLDAGYDQDNPLQITYKTSSDPFRIRIASMIQQQLSSAGIKLNIQSYDWGTFFADIKAGRFQLYSLTWVGLNNPDVFRTIFHSQAMPPNGANRGRLDDLHIDNLIKQAENSSNRELKAAIYQKLYRQLLLKLPYMPLWYEDQVLITRSNILGYRLAKDGDYDALLNVSKQESVE